MFEREIQKIKIILKPYFWESWFIKNNSFLLRLNHLWSNWMESMGFNHLCEILTLDVETNYNQQNSLHTC